MDLLTRNKLKQAIFFLFSKIVTVKEQIIALEVQKKQKKLDKIHKKQTKVTK